MRMRSAIITGSSRGIGRAIAKRLAGEGLGVTINYVSQQGEAESLLKEITEAGGQAIVVQGDVANPADCERLYAETEKAFGGVDVLVNNAGILKILPIAETDDALFARTFDINVRGSFNMMRLAAKRLRHGGRVINFSTSAIGVALPGYAVYAASKAAIETMTNIFAKEMRGKQITVNAVAPGPTATELFFDGKDEAFVERLKMMSPLERLGEPEDIARVVSFLAGPEGGWVNGQTLRANGGTV